MMRVDDFDGGVRIEVKVIPGASRTRYLGLLDGRLKIAVAAAPERGKANAELEAFVARRLGLRRRDVSVEAGRTSPIKTLHIANVESEAVRRAFNG